MPDDYAAGADTVMTTLTPGRPRRAAPHPGTFQPRRSGWDWFILGACWVFGVAVLVEFIAVLVIVL